MVGIPPTWTNEGPGTTLSKESVRPLPPTRRLNQTEAYQPGRKTPPTPPPKRRHQRSPLDSPSKNAGAITQILRTRAFRLPSYVNAQSVGAKEVPGNTKVPIKVQSLANAKSVNVGKSFKHTKVPDRDRIKLTLSVFKQRLKTKDERTYAMMTRLQNILVGTIFRTEYVFHGASPYVGVCPGYAKVRKKPSFEATRLLVTQILHCRSNIPIQWVERIINS